MVKICSDQAHLIRLTDEVDRPLSLADGRAVRAVRLTGNLVQAVEFELMARRKVDCRSGICGHLYPVIQAAYVHRDWQVFAISISFICCESTTPLHQKPTGRHAAPGQVCRGYDYNHFEKPFALLLLLGNIQICTLYLCTQMHPDTLTIVEIAQLILAAKRKHVMHKVLKKAAAYMGKLGRVPAA